ncbi:MAG: ribosome maturation factor RimP [bacterium]
MDKQKNIAEKVYNIAAYSLTRLGYEVIDVEYRREKHGNVLRVFIDKKGKVTAEDCEKATRVLSDVIDVNVPIHFSYTLEVSSPGLTRELKRKEEYIRFSGRDIRIITREPILNKVVVEGTLRGMRDDNVIIDNDGIETEIPYSIIKRANLTFKL